jgi:hypothetical protein
MAKKIKFVEWKPKAILEKDLSEGVRYSFPFADAGVAEFIAARDGGAVGTMLMNKPCCEVYQAGCRGTSTVRILDWPSWCGPRPDEITLKQAIERIGDDGVVAVVVDCGDGHIETYDESDRNEFRDMIECNAAKVLGFVVAEDDA